MLYLTYKAVETLILQTKLTQINMDENETNTCEYCGGDGYIEIIGDGDNFECDVIGHKDCPECNYE